MTLIVSSQSNMISKSPNARARARSRPRVSRAVRAPATGARPRPSGRDPSGSRRFPARGAERRAPSTGWVDSGALGACVHFLASSRSIRRLVALRACARLRMRCESGAGRNAMRAPDGQCERPRRGAGATGSARCPRAWPAAPRSAAHHYLLHWSRPLAASSPRLYIYPVSPSLPHPWLCLQQRLGSSRT